MLKRLWLVTFSLLLVIGCANQIPQPQPIKPAEPKETKTTNQNRQVSENEYFRRTVAGCSVLGYSAMAASIMFQKGYSYPEVLDALKKEVSAQKYYQLIEEVVFKVSQRSTSDNQTITKLNEDAIQQCLQTAKIQGMGYVINLNIVHAVANTHDARIMSPPIAKQFIKNMRKIIKSPFSDQINSFKGSKLELWRMVADLYRPMYLKMENTYNKLSFCAASGAEIAQRMVQRWDKTLNYNKNHNSIQLFGNHIAIKIKKTVTLQNIGSLPKHENGQKEALHAIHKYMFACNQQTQTDDEQEQTLQIAMSFPLYFYTINRYHALKAQDDSHYIKALKPVNEKYRDEALIFYNLTNDVRFSSLKQQVALMALEVRKRLLVGLNNQAMLQQP